MPEENTSGSTGCETRSAAPVEFPAGAAVTIFTTIHPAPATPLMPPVIAIVIVVPSAVGDGRGAENAKRDPGSDPTAAASCLLHQHGGGLGGLDA